MMGTTTHNVAHEDILAAARWSIKVLAEGIGAAKSEIFHHVLEQHPEFAPGVLRAIDEAWRDPDLIHFKAWGSDKVMFEFDEKRAASPQPPCGQRGIHLVKR
jgi:hypothetical protein